MVLSNEAKEKLRKEIVSLLARFPEVRRIVIFGSFITSSEPHDLDVAVFQDSEENYYSLAMKYRCSLRSVANQIPLDVIPLRRSPEQSAFRQHLDKGEVLYER
jgi:predicted nucleotidyltransferase